MTNYTCIGIGTTDENGIAHITHDCEGNPLSEPGYHGSGAGETLIIASLDKPVSVESILSNNNKLNDGSLTLVIIMQASILAIIGLFKSSLKIVTPPKGRSKTSSTFQLNKSATKRCPNS